jgi:hypothetical protein
LDDDPLWVETFRTTQGYEIRQIYDEEYCAFCSLSVANSKSIEQATFTDKARVKAEGILQILYIIPLYSYGAKKAYN